MVEAAKEAAREVARVGVKVVGREACRVRAAERDAFHNLYNRFQMRTVLRRHSAP
jgi:hypothetical protein